MDQQPNFELVGLLCNLHLEFLCSSDPQQLSSVEDSERLLTACMLQVVSALTLRSIKNTSIHIHFLLKKFLFLFCNPLVPLSRLEKAALYLYFCFCIAVSVRDLGMVPYIKIFLDEDQFRGPTLRILEQLAEINPEEFMSTAIGALCSSTQQELGLKRDLLQVFTFYMQPQQHTDTSRTTRLCSDLS